VSASDDGRSLLPLRALDPSSGRAKENRSFDDLASLMDKFVESKGWYGEESLRPQTARNLATSLMIEVGELLECFQWSDDADRAKLEDEVADVVLYLVQLSRIAGIDPVAVAFEKLDRNRLRAWDSDVRANSG
jgi:NTP pyrophosphatase (non-canonical NTP hydrolase)